MVEAPLGSGGFGAVYRGVHPVIGKQAAIKILSTRYSSDPTVVSRFVSEARAVHKIGHSNIIDIFSFGQLPDGRPYYVMELLDGVTLLDLIQRRGKLSIAEALDILEPIAGAIDAAHKHGVAHRDLKPDNIFLARDGDRWRPKLLDFGVAKLMDEAMPRQHRTATGATLGTPAYMAPEQCIGRNIDHRADIYAFGVVTFEMLTGVLPFTGESQFEVMTAHVSTPPPAPDQFAPDLPAGFSRAILWLLEKDREQRPQSLAEAIRILRATAEGAPFESAKVAELSAPAPVAVVTPRPQRRKYLFLAAASIGSALAIAAIGLFDRSEPPAIEPPREVTTQMALRDEPPSPPPITMIKVEVRGVPNNARILDPRGVELGVGPSTIDLARATEAIALTIEAPSFQKYVVDLTPDRDQTIAVQLQPIVPAAKSKRPSKNNINELEPWR